MFFRSIGGVSSFGARLSLIHGLATSYSEFLTLLHYRHDAPFVDNGGGLRFYKGAKTQPT